MKRLILIPARSGSTRVINKNLKTLAGRPLIAHVIANALSADCARVIVSTNCSEIAGVAQHFGAEVPFNRPNELATAESTSVSCVIHALRWLQRNEDWRPEILAFCPPTNPFLEPSSLRSMFTLLEKRTDRNAIVTVCRVRTHPFRCVALEPDGSVKNGIVEIGGKTINDLERSQDWPDVWEGSPACRMTRTSYFAKYDNVPEAQCTGKTYDVSSSLGFRIGQKEALDVDEEQDFVLANALAGSALVKS